MSQILSPISTPFFTFDEDFHPTVSLTALITQAVIIATKGRISLNPKDRIDVELYKAPALFAKTMASAMHAMYSKAQISAQEYACMNQVLEQFSEHFRSQERWGYFDHDQLGQQSKSSIHDLEAAEQCSEFFQELRAEFEEAQRESYGDAACCDEDFFELPF